MSTEQTRAETLTARMEKMYRLALDAANYKATTWEAIAKLAMEQNADHAAMLAEMRIFLSQLNARIIESDKIIAAQQVSPDAEKQRIDPAVPAETAEKK